MPTLSELQEQLKPIIGDAQWFGDGQWDSLAHIQVMCLLEEKHSMEVTEERIGRLTSLQAILDEVNHA
jgi:acyl carrier protein